MPIANHEIESQIEKIALGLNREDPLPLYQQIVGLLTQPIEQGLWIAGQALPTQKRLAKLLGVSEMTVRRAMSDLVREGRLASRQGSGTVVTPGRPGVDWTRIADRQPAAEPSSGQGLLRLGVVFASIHDGYPFVQPMLEALESPAGPDSAASPSVRLQVLYLDPHESDPRAIAHQLPLDDIDGLILNSPTNAALLWLCQYRSLPYVMLFNDMSDGVSTCITCDYFTGILDAVAAATQVGRTRMALVTAGPMRYSTGQISQALHGACRMHNLPLPESAIVHADYTQQQGQHATEQLLNSPDPPDTIFYSSDHLACGGLMAAQAMGLRVPEDVAIIGAGGGAVLNAMPWPQRLSTIDLGLGEMGRQALAAIQEQAASVQAAPQRLIVRSRFLAGQTTP